MIPITASKDSEADEDQRAAQALLTARERAVLTCAAAGMSNLDIADCLLIRPRTAEHHLSRAFAKLAVKNRVQAINKGRALGLLPR